MLQPSFRADRRKSQQKEFALREPPPYLAMLPELSEESAERMRGVIEREYASSETLSLVLDTDRALRLGKRMSEERKREEHAPKEKQRNRAEIRRIYEDLTEYNFTLTHAILSSDDAGYLTDLHDALLKLAQGGGNEQQFERVWSGAIAQAATFRIFQALGAAPELPRPKDDALRAIDMWSDDEHAVQIKSGSALEIIEVTSASLPAVRVRGAAGEAHYVNSGIDGAVERFRYSLSRYNEEQNTSVRGYFIVIPHGMVDRITGEPTPELLAFVRSHPAFVTTPRIKQTDTNAL